MSPERKLTKKVEKVTLNPPPVVVEHPKPEPVFDSVNFLHDKDKKVALDDLDNEGFVQKSFNSGSSKIIVDLNAQTILVPKAKEPPPVDTLLHHGVSGVHYSVKPIYNPDLLFHPISYLATMQPAWRSG